PFTWFRAPFVNSACGVGRLLGRIGQLRAESRRLLRLAERVVRRHQVLPCVYQPAHSPIGPLREYLVASECLSHRLCVTMLAQQRPAQFDSRNASVQMLGSLSLCEDADRLSKQRL